MKNRTYLAFLAMTAVLAVAWVTGYLSLAALGAGVGVTVFGMILDERSEFCDATSVVKTAGASYLVGDVMDLTVARNIGAGLPPLYLVIQVDTEIITAGSAGTIEFLLCSDAQAAIAVDGTQTVHFRSRAFVTDDSAANDAEMNAGGVPVCIAIPMEGKVYERYLGVVVTVTTTDTTAGKINAFLTTNPKAWKALDDGR